MHYLLANYMYNGTGNVHIFRLLFLQQSLAFGSAIGGWNLSLVNNMECHDKNEHTFDGFNASYNGTSSIALSVRDATISDGLCTGIAFGCYRYGRDISGAALSPARQC